MAYQAPVSALSHSPTKMSGSKGLAPWRGSKGQSLLVGSGAKPRRLRDAQAIALTPGGVAEFKWSRPKR